MVMIAAKPIRTIDDYMKLPEGTRVELFEGEFFMSPSPVFDHQKIILNLAMLLRTHARSRGLGEVILSPFDCHLSRITAVQPDIVFVAAAHLGRIQGWLRGAPDLAIEVLSPTHEERDRIVKRDLYAKYGVPEYWIVDPEARTVEVFSLSRDRYEPRGYFRDDESLASPLLPDFRPALREIFE